VKLYVREERKRWRGQRLAYQRTLESTLKGWSTAGLIRNFHRPNVKVDIKERWYVSAELSLDFSIVPAHDGVRRAIRGLANELTENTKYKIYRADLDGGEMCIIFMQGKES
jgi:hypothetical protein